MRKLLCCALALCWLNSEALAQLRSSSVNTLTTRLIDDKGQLVNSKTYQGLQANSFDISQFILENVDDYRVKVSGLFRTDNTVDYINFDSESIEEMGATEYCEVSESTIKPLLGIEVKSCDNLQGVEVSRLAANTNATYVDIQIGDNIISLNGETINSYCDLKMLVNETNVGEEISLAIIRKGKKINQRVVVGAQISNKVSYKPCEPSDPGIDFMSNGDEVFAATLNSYPNPTKGESFIQFESNLKVPTNLYIMNDAGAIIEKQSHPFFNESLRLNYDFTGLPDGIYYVIMEQEDRIYKSKIIYFAD